jgi:hypothetical protein
MDGHSRVAAILVVVITVRAAKIKIGGGPFSNLFANRVSEWHIHGLFLKALDGIFLVKHDEIGKEYNKNWKNLLLDEYGKKRDWMMLWLVAM